MKPWDSQVTFLVFQTFFRPHTPSPQVEGGAGEKMSSAPLDSGDVGWAPLRCRRLRSALDYSGFGLTVAGRPRHPDTPRRPFVQAVLGKGCPSRGQTKLRADATGSQRSRHLGVVPTALTRFAQ